MESLKDWAKEHPVIAIAAALILATLANSVFYGSADVPL